MIRFANRLFSISWSRGLWLVLVTLAELIHAAPVSSAEIQKKVLVLYSQRRDLQIAVLGDRELPRILGDGLPEGLDYHSEYIDLSRFPDPEYQAGLRDYLRLKYKGQRFHLLIAMDDRCLDFAKASRDELFPEAPVVFYTRAPGSRRLENSTGVIEAVNLRDTVTLATTLQPDIRHVFVVIGADGTSAGSESDVRAQLHAFEPGLSFTYLTGLPTSDLDARLATLPDHSVIYYLGVGRDGAGTNVHPLEYLDRIARLANAPIYSFVDSAMDHGIVGGALRSQLAQVHAIGNLALRVLRGERADAVPVSSPELRVTQIDWRQLRRWGISERRVPAGTVVRFQGPSLWRDYRQEVLLGFAGLVIQSLLIVGLLYQRRARRQAEIENRRNLSLAADANRRMTMSALTGSIAHELSQPLNAILHNVQAGEMMMASSRATPEILRNILADIRTADVRATGIIERHRTMLKSHAIETKPIDIHAVVRESVALVAHETKKRQIPVDVDLPPTPCIVTGDHVLLQQVVVNLMMNAMDAMAETPAGRRSITVRSEVAQDRVTVSVHDAGSGLPQTLDGTLFEPFVTTKANGMGIGLTIVRTIVEAHRGRMEARNNAEGGATFTMTLPFDPLQSPHAPGVQA